MLLEAYKQLRTRMMLVDVWGLGFTEPLLTGFGCVTTTQGSTRYRPRSGWLRATISTQDRYIQLMHLHHRFRTPISQTPVLRWISSQTVISDLCQACLPATRPVWCTVVKTYCWTTTVVARTYLMCTVENRFFSKESRFMLFRAAGGSRMYWCHNECCVTIVFWNMIHFGCGSVIVWDSPWWSYCRGES